MKEVKMARKCTIQGCNGQYIEVFYADAEYVTLFSTGTPSYNDTGFVVLFTAQYPSFSVRASANETIKGIEDSEFEKSIAKRLLLAERNEYFVRKDGTVIKLTGKNAYALTVAQYTQEEFSELVKEAAFALCKA